MCLGVHGGTLGIRSSGTGACPALAYPPQVKYHLSHGVSVAVMLPYVMEYNLIGNLEKYANVAQAMGEKVEGLSVFDAAYRSVEAIKRLIKDLSLPLKLREVGAKKEGIEVMAQEAIQSKLPLNTPRKMTVDDIKFLYEKAFA